jgi:hypothetical protein
MRKVRTGDLLEGGKKGNNLRRFIKKATKNNI